MSGLTTAADRTAQAILDFEQDIEIYRRDPEMANRRVIEILGLDLDADAIRPMSTPEGALAFAARLFPDCAVETRDDQGVTVCKIQPKGWLAAVRRRDPDPAIAVTRCVLLTYYHRLEGEGPRAPH